jgi:hypothetical protein
MGTYGLALTESGSMTVPNILRTVPSGFASMASAADGRVIGFRIKYLLWYPVPPREPSMTTSRGAVLPVATDYNNWI